MESLLQERERLIEKRFHSFFHFMENIDIKQCNRRMLEALNQSGAFLSLGYKRKSLEEAMEMGLAHAQKTQNDRLSGQTSLFGNFDSIGGQSEIIPQGSDVTEFPESELLSMEREVLGFYLSGHPLEKYKRKLRNARIPTIEDLHNLPGAKQLEVAVVVSDYSMRLTRSGAEMCRLSVEDMTGSCEAVILPAALKKIRKEELKKGALLLLGAVLEKREETGTPSLLIHKLTNLDSDLISERQEKSLHIKLKQSSGKTQVINQLKTILAASQGPLCVYFHLLDNGERKVKQVIRAHESFRVDYSHELCKRLSSIQNVYAVDLSIGDQLMNKYKREASLS